MLDLLVVQVFELGPDEGCRSGHVGGGHGRAAGCPVAGGITERAAARGHGGENVHTGRSQVHPGLAVVRKAGILVVVIRGRHGDDVLQIVSCRITGAAGVSVARRTDVERLVGACHGLLQRLRGTAAAPTVVGDQNVLLLFVLEGVDVVEALDGPRRGAGAERAQKLAADDAHVPVDAGDADAVVAHRADGAGHVGAMAEVIHGIAGVVDDVDAVEVIHVAVVVIVFAVGLAFAVALRALLGIHPDVLGQVLMVVVDARVDHGHDHVFRACVGVPGLQGVDVRVGRAAGLSRVV